MGNQEDLKGKDHSLLNGLLPCEAPRATMIFDTDKWSMAESRIDELIQCIQPNPHSEDCRNAVVNYVRRLISKCFSCRVFTFGSVPLKTYLPDGDIDMSAFSKNKSLKDTWANEVRDVLEIEEKSKNADFRVKEVQYIQAEVKIIKCLVENIVVDISFDQLGGQCTLCFLGKIDQFINQDHLFKRSIILIKAWCYYESRILGAHHGLISTYALEILVLYIFRVFNNSFTGPLEVLYRFLEFFSNFDWDNFCVSLWGPVPVSSLPDISAVAPWKDARDLLLNKHFLDYCISKYSVSPGGQENQGQPFISKFFNVIDPLRPNNNLGRSVSKGNFFRIRSAFTFGAKRLAGLLECPTDRIISEVNMFFMNTWKRHGNGQRPDAPRFQLRSLQPSDHPAPVDEKSRNSQNQSEVRSTENHRSTLPRENQTGAGVYGSGSLTSLSRLSSQRTSGNQTISRTSDQIDRNMRSSIEQPARGVRVQKSSSRPIYASTDSQGTARIQFSRTRSSPELSDSSSVSSGRRQTNPETIKSYIMSSNSRFTASDSSDMNNSSNQSLDITTDSSRGYHNDSGFVTSNDNFTSIPEDLLRQQEEQDMVNRMASSTISGFNGQIQLPTPFPLSPSVLASMGDPRKNLAGILPLINSHGGSIMQFSHGLPSSSMPRYFSEESSSMRALTGEDDNGFWPDQTESGSRGSTPDRRSFQGFHSDDRHLTENSGDSFILGQHKFVREGQETYSTDAVASSSFTANAQASSSRSKSSENSKLVNRRGRKSTPSTSYVALKRGPQYEESSSVHAEVDEHNEWIPLSVMGTEVGGERNTGPSSMAHLASFEPAQLSGSDSVLPMAPMLISSAVSQSRTGDSSGVMPFTFYPYGHLVPFLTMLPFCNFPSESGNFDGSAGMEDNTLDNEHLNPSGNKSFDLGENLEHMDAHSSPGSAKGTSFEYLKEHKYDILNSNLPSHEQNLQYARLCQGTQFPSSAVYPSPMVFPPVYLQGHFPWDGPGRPFFTNMNLSPLVNYGPQFPSVASAQLSQGRQQQSGVFQRYGDDIPRYRGGTGTYLPNPKVPSYRERPSSRTRNSHRGNYGYERHDHLDREGSWSNSKSSRGANRRNNQPEKSTLRPDRLAAPETRSRPSNLPPGAHPLAAAPNCNGSGMMLYPYEGGCVDFGSSEQLEFGSLRPVQLVGEGSRSMERSQTRVAFDQRQGAIDHHQGSPRSSPEPPSPPVHRRGS